MECYGAAEGDGRRGGRGPRRMDKSSCFKLHHTAPALSARPLEEHM